MDFKSIVPLILYIFSKCVRGIRHGLLDLDKDIGEYLFLKIMIRLANDINPRNNVISCCSI